MGGDAETRAGRGQHGAVDAVDLGEGQGGGELVQPQPPLLVHRLVLQPDAEATGGKLECLGDDEPVPREIDIDRRAGVHRIGQSDQSDPKSRIARHGIAEQAVVEHLLDVGGREHRHLEVLEGVFRLRRQSGRLTGVIVAGHGEHAALWHHAREVRMFEHVSGAVDAGRLAVPHAEDAIVQRAGKQVRLLAAPDGGGAQILIDRFLEHDIAGLEQLARPFGLLVQSAQRRAAIAGDETRGVQARPLVEATLVQQDAQQGLNPGDEDAAVLGDELVVEGDIRMFQESSPRRTC